MAPKLVTEIVRLDELAAYLELHGLRVVRGGWQWGAQRPWVITGPALPAEANIDESKEAGSDTARDGE